MADEMEQQARALAVGCGGGGRAGVCGQAQHRYSQPRDALRHGRSGSGLPAHSYGTWVHYAGSGTMGGEAERVTGDGCGGMGWRHGQAPRDTQRVCQPPDAAGLGQQARSQCPAADAAMDGRRTDVLGRGGSAVCRVGGIGVGGVDNGGLTHLRLDLRLELWVAMGGTLCAWSVLERAVACSRAPAGCVRCVVAGPHCLAPATAAPRTQHHAHCHGPAMSRHTHEHSVWPCGHGLWLWGVGCGPRRPAPPRTAATPHLPTPVVPTAVCGRSRPHPLRSTTPEITRRTPGIPFSPSSAWCQRWTAAATDQGVCDVTEACGLGRSRPEGVWVAAAATPRPGRPRPPPPTPRPITARRAS